MQNYSQSTPDVEIAFVTRVYQTARRGSKALIRWPTGYTQDTWFHFNWPRAGSTVLLRGSTGWGPHNRNPEVFYVNQDQLLDLLPPGAMAAVERQRRREAKRTG